MCELSIDSLPAGSENGITRNDQFMTATVDIVCGSQISDQLRIGKQGGNFSLCRLVLLTDGPNEYSRLKD